jgi:hypothetical protein
MRPTRLIRSAIVLKPSTILSFHRALVKRKYRLLFTPKTRDKPGPSGPSPELVSAILEMKRRNPNFGYQCITDHSLDLMVRPGSLSLATVKTVCGVWTFFDVNR